MSTFIYSLDLFLNKLHGGVTTEIYLYVFLCTHSGTGKFLTITCNMYLVHIWKKMQHSQKKPSHESI